MPDSSRILSLVSVAAETQAVYAALDIHTPDPDGQCAACAHMGARRRWPCMHAATAAARGVRCRQQIAEFNAQVSAVVDAVVDRAAVRSITAP